MFRQTMCQLAIEVWKSHNECLYAVIVIFENSRSDEKGTSIEIYERVYFVLAFNTIGWTG